MNFDKDELITINTALTELVKWAISNEEPFIQNRALNVQERILRAINKRREKV